MLLIYLPGRCSSVQLSAAHPRRCLPHTIPPTAMEISWIHYTLRAARRAKVASVRQTGATRKNKPRESCRNLPSNLWAFLGGKEDLFFFFFKICSSCFQRLLWIHIHLFWRFRTDNADSVFALKMILCWSTDGCKKKQNHEPRSANITKTASLPAGASY